MTVLAVVGAGRGLGAAVARRFGQVGFDVALLARSQERVDALAGELGAEGIGARGFAADVRDRASLSAALDRAADTLGPVEVLQYSPIPQPEFLRPVLETTPEDLAAALEFSVHGPVTAVTRVLPGMRALGRGTVLLVNGGSAARPDPRVAGTSVAFAGESAYGQMLHDVLAGEGIHVGQLVVPGAITPGDARTDPAVLADTLWAMHTERDGFRRLARDLDA
ncbi:Short-chain dehydrogenase [Geodermatophilus pulveris]|uniref:Short-chain dehydrogenase n=1 Tax=Geodermatophilus pulveris TaxID=1564159 RepID=A0A239CMY8_9ACTN|nr:SDR family NAD(P)-dependent oxidoreductase [Geodermatophilus pulveris]SNS21232.1 Short-chain dehydrogenase [Geodermatophilus pulveris]